jgi:hypothetical protein
MISVMGRNAIAAAVLIAAGVVGLGAAPAQETWGGGGSRGSSSHSAGPASGGTTQSGTAHGASPVSGATGSGGGSSWTAGKDSFHYAAQPGGIWSVSAPSTGSSAPSAGSSAPGTHASGRSLRPAGLSPLPSARSATVHVNTQQATHMAQPSGGHTTSAGSRAGSAKGGHGGAPGSAGVKGFAPASRNKSGSRGSGKNSYGARKGSGLNPKAPGTNQSK